MLDKILRKDADYTLARYSTIATIVLTTIYLLGFDYMYSHYGIGGAVIMLPVGGMAIVAIYGLWHSLFSAYAEHLLDLHIVSIPQVDLHREEYGTAYVPHVMEKEVMNTNDRLIASAIHSAKTLTKNLEVLEDIRSYRELTKAEQDQELKAHWYMKHQPEYFDPDFERRFASGELPREYRAKV